MRHFPILKHLKRCSANKNFSGVLHNITWDELQWILQRIYQGWRFTSSIDGVRVYQSDEPGEKFRGRYQSTSPCPWLVWSSVSACLQRPGYRIVSKMQRRSRCEQQAASPLMYGGTVEDAFTELYRSINREFPVYENVFITFYSVTTSVISYPRLKAHNYILAVLNVNKSKFV